MSKPLIPNDPSLKAAVIEALHEVLSYPTDDDKGNVLIQRIPFICKDIRAIQDAQLATTASQNAMSADIKKINDNLTWAVRVVIGAVIIAVLKVAGVF